MTAGQAEANIDERRALRAVLLFYSPDWSGAQQREWEELTGRKEATTRALCDFVREVLGDPPRRSPEWPRALEPGAK